MPTTHHPQSSGAILALTFGTLLAFLLLASLVAAGLTQRFDEGLLLAFRTAEDRSDPLGPLWFEEVMRDVTALGGTSILVTLSLIVVGHLMLSRKRHAAAMVVCSVGGGMLASHLLKLVFDRPRPDLVPHGMAVFTQSFPSGHAMLSAVVYLTLGALLARTSERLAIRAYLVSVAALLTVVVGLSRLYLGVHWPTDVIGGWLVGIAWSSMCWQLMLKLQQRGSVEQA